MNPIDEAIRHDLISALRDNYTCGRVWSAWQVGTMGEDDFSPAWENDDLISELENVVCDAIHAARDSDKVAAASPDLLAALEARERHKEAHAEWEDHSTAMNLWEPNLWAMENKRLHARCRELEAIADELARAALLRAKGGR